MQQTHNSSCDLFTIAYAIDITFGIKVEQSRYIVPQMWLDLQNTINNRYICSFPKYPCQVPNIHPIQIAPC